MTVLTASGFTGIDLVALHEAVCYGPDLDGGVRSPADRSRALDRLDSLLRDNQTDDGVWFDSHAWLVTARRAPGQ